MKEKEQDIKIFESFGCEDSVFNHLKMLVDIDNGKKDEVLKNAENALNKRRFSVECITNCEFFTLNWKNIDKMKK